MRATRIAFVATIVAAAACTDSTSPVTPNASKHDYLIHGKTTTTATSAAPTSLYAGYSARSPHWQHITTMMTDFYYGWTPAERAWAGAHYDDAMSGSGSAWRAVNPSVGHFPYALSWTTMTNSGGLASSYYADMKSWYATHTQYTLEKAFVHRKGASVDSAGRIFFNHWGTNRWAINPADAGAIAYSVDRVRRVIGGDAGVFFDETSSGDINARLPATLEFPSGAAYYNSLTQLLRSLRVGIAGKIMLLNLSEYTTEADYQAAVAAGGVHLEMFNNFKHSGMIPRWQWVGRLMSAGIFVDFVSTYSSQDVANMTASYPPGNSTTSVQRAKLWELASYYLAVQASPTLLGLQLENQWSKPYSSLWLKAQEANIGHPLAARVQAAHGMDPMGNAFIVYNRDFDRALIVLRLQQGWGAQSYGDKTAVRISLPAGQKWMPLNADGTVGPIVTSIRLRNSEAAIMLKVNTM